MTYHQCLAAIGLWLLTCVPAYAEEPSAPRYGTWGLDLTAMDPSVRPGDDFNRYASGTWLKNTDIPADRPLETLRLAMNDATEARVHSLLESAAAQAPAEPRTLEQKVGAFFRSFMAEDRIEALGAKAIAPELDAIRNAKSRDALAALMGETNSDFYPSLFSIDVDVDLKDIDHYAVQIGQNGIGLPDREYYLSSAHADDKAAYQAYVASLLKQIDWPNAEARAAEVVAFETRVAEAEWTKVEQRDLEKTYNPMTVAQLTAFAPGFAWREFLRHAGLAHSSRVVVAEKSALPRMAAIYQSTPLRVLKAWAAARTADSAAPYLSSAFVQARFAFRDQRLSEQHALKVRWKRGVSAVAGGDCLPDPSSCFGTMGFGVGQLYVGRYFPPNSKTQIETLVRNLQAAMRARLQRVDWMAPATRQEALKKLDTYQIKVGYPDHFRDYSQLIIRADDLVGNVRRAAVLDWTRKVDRLRAPVDRSDWIMTPQTNDAYNGNLRDIVFPAALLQPPLFDPMADPAVNYGAIGAYIGHEITHGFDDQGRKLDAAGRLRDWWTPEDAAAFQARAKRLASQYSAYEPIPGARVNGDLTLGENIADLGGVNIALEAYHRSMNGAETPSVDGLTGDQRVLLGWAQAWRGKATDAFLRNQVLTDPHSPRAFRVIGPTRNIDAWYDAFGVKPGEAYYLKPEDRVHIW